MCREGVHCVCIVVFCDWSEMPAMLVQLVLT